MASTESGKMNSMKTLFPGYYKPSEKEYKEIWEKANIILDTNVLLDFFRISTNTATKLLQALQNYKDKVYLPYQVAYEYHKDLEKVITTQISNYDNSEKDIEKFFKSLGSKRMHPYLPSTLQKEADGLFLKIKNCFDDQKRSLFENFTRRTIKDKIADLYEGKIGEIYSKDIIDKICADGERRYEAKTPPGYMDGNKPAPEKFGDLFVWYDVIERSKAEKCPIIFVTNDKKEDWLWKINGKTVGPRPELIKEFRDRTGNLICIYTLLDFWEKISKSVGIGDDVIKEIKEQKEQEKLDSDDTNSPVELIASIESISDSNSNVEGSKKLIVPSCKAKRITPISADEPKENIIENLKQETINKKKDGNTDKDK